MTSQIRELLDKILCDLKIPALKYAIELPPSSVDFDLATNLALAAGAQDGQTPKEIAEKISAILEESDLVAKSEVAGPGFINIKISDKYLSKELLEIVKTEKYGSNNEGKDRTICVEYVSANPTGQVHIGNARGGPIGESIANLFEYFGYKVARRFYVNDIGGQIEKLASTFYHYYEKHLGQKSEFPEGGYPGEYIKSVSEKIIKKNEEVLATLKDKDEILGLLQREGLKITVENMKKEVALLGINFDYFDYQSELEESGKTEQAIALLESGGSTTKKEGALWFKNPDDAEMADSEAVLRKSDDLGTLTYFADDVAYHIEKYKEGYEQIVDILGSNHHGHLPRMRAVIKALDLDVNKFQVILYQFVQIKNGEEIIKMSKRMGNFVTLSQVLEGGVSPDAFKYFILAQNNDTPIDFDVKLASERSEKNPVFYIQYAHARIASVIKKSKIEAKLNISKLNQDVERQIIRTIITFPALLLDVKKSFQIQKIAHFAYNLASLFHEYYAGTQILVDEKELSASRLFLILCVKKVLASSLDILDINAPEQM